MSGLSPSGARIRGDDFQHAYAATRAIETLPNTSDITDLGVEDPDPDLHNADDVTVYRCGVESEFVQAKSAVDATSSATVEWLISPSDKGGPSILQHLHAAWTKLTARELQPRLRLVTNKLVDPSDSVLVHREGTDGTVARRLGEGGPASARGKARAVMAAHLEVSEEDLLSFLEQLSFKFGYLMDDVRNDLSYRLMALGLRSDADAQDQCIGMIRGWVTAGRRVLTADQVREDIASLGLETTKPAAAVIVQAIDWRSCDAAAVNLDWVERFDGFEARSRRVPRDPNDWNDAFRPEMLAAAQEIRSAGYSRAHIGGAMRLPTWFAVGNAFGETAGFELETSQSGQLWTSSGPVNDSVLEVSVKSTGTSGDQAAIVISIATDILDDVREHVTTLSSIGSILHLRPEGGPGATAIGDPQGAKDMAVAVRNKVRKFVQKHRPSRVHVFLACPGGFAMLLGHRWDRIADTQLYADLAPGYAPAYFIPN